MTEIETKIGNDKYWSKVLREINFRKTQWIMTSKIRNMTFWNIIGICRVCSIDAKKNQILWRYEIKFLNFSKFQKLNDQYDLLHWISLVNSSPTDKFECPEINKISIISKMSYFSNENESPYPTSRLIIRELNKLWICMLPIKEIYWWLLIL